MIKYLFVLLKIFKVCIHLLTFRKICSFVCFFFYFIIIFVVNKDCNQADDDAAAANQQLAEAFNPRNILGKYHKINQFLFCCVLYLVLHSTEEGLNLLEINYLQSSLQ